MNKRWATALLWLLLVVPTAGLCAGSEGMALVPADFPFPHGVSTRSFTQHDSDSVWVFVDFSYAGDPDSLYVRFKWYAMDNGFKIDREKHVEETGHRRLDAHKGPTRSLIVGTNQDGHIQVVFQIPLSECRPDCHSAL